MIGTGLTLNLFLWLEYLAEKQSDNAASTDNTHDYSQVGNTWDWLLRTFVSPSDTLAQWIMSAFTVVAVVLVWRTLKATQEMVRDTRHIGEAQVRAYLKIERARVQQYGDKITVEVTVKNSGQSPARHVHFVPEIIYNVTVPDMPGWTSTRFAYTNGWDLGDIAAGGTVNSGTISFSDIGFDENAALDGDGAPIVGTVNIGVFAADVFNVEIFDGVETSVFKHIQVHPSFMEEYDRESYFQFRQIFITQGLRGKGWESTHSKGKKPSRKQYEP